MAQGFTVIQGGRRDGGVPADASPAGGPLPLPVHPSREAWRVDLHRAGAVEDGAVAAWRALLVRNAIDDPRADPDYLLTAARHQAKREHVVFALAWDRDGAADAALTGIVPLALPDPLWGRGMARAWQPPGEAGAGGALIDGERGDAVESAIRRRLAALPRSCRVGAVARVQGGGVRRPVVAASRSAGGRRALSADSLVGVRPADYVAEAEAEHVCDPARVPAAVEQFLALDARSAPAPIIADPSEASMVRVVTRLFARRGQMRVELARRAGQVVSGALHLGTGARALVWRRAAMP